MFLLTSLFLICRIKSYPNIHLQHWLTSAPVTPDLTALTLFKMQMIYMKGGPWSLTSFKIRVLSLFNPSTPIDHRNLAISPITEGTGKGKFYILFNTSESHRPECIISDVTTLLLSGFVLGSSTPRPRCVNSQLVSLPPVGILNSLRSFEIFS